jgi:calcium-dependent protein kinase
MVHPACGEFFAAPSQDAGVRPTCGEVCATVNALPFHSMPTDNTKAKAPDEAWLRDAFDRAVGGARVTKTDLPTVALGAALAPRVCWAKVKTRTCNPATTAARYHRCDLSQDYDVCNHEVLGEGCSGKVVVARSFATGKKSALKRIRKASVSPSALQQLMAEAEIFLTLDHPNVAQLNDVYDTDTEIAFLTECLDGGELFARLAENHLFPEVLAAETTRQMLRAVGYLHSHGIVHRDLKLENFLYESHDFDSPLKVIDFGFAKVWDPSKPMRATCGSIAYVSPDVLSGKGYTSKCDLWSLGVIVFMLLVGYPPFHGDNDRMRADILAGNVDWRHTRRWAAVSESAMSFVRLLLQPDSTKRLDAARALNHEWLVNTAPNPPSPRLSAATIRSIGSYAVAPSLKRAVLQLLVQELEPSDVADLRRTFLELADEEEGTVSFSRLKAAIRDDTPASQVDTDPKTPSRKIRRAKTEQLKALFEVMDVNGDDRIYYSDFVAATMNENFVLREEHIRATFHRLDADHSGAISPEDLQAVIGDTFEGLETSQLIEDAGFGPTAHGELDFESFTRVLGGSCRFIPREETFGC